MPSIKRKSCLCAFRPFGLNQPRKGSLCCKWRSDNLNIIVTIYPTNARVVTLAFQEYAKGSHTFISLAQFLADLGVVTRNQTPLAKVSIKRLLTHRAYLGFVKHGDEWFDGNFEPIVTPALFEAV